MLVYGAENSWNSLPPILFVCTHNSARSQLAAALWTATTGREALSAGTQPATRVHPGAVAAAARAGLVLDVASGDFQAAYAAFHLAETLTEDDTIAFNAGTHREL